MRRHPKGKTPPEPASRGDASPPEDRPPAGPPGPDLPVHPAAGPLPVPAPGQTPAEDDTGLWLLPVDGGPI